MSPPGTSPTSGSLNLVVEELRSFGGAGSPCFLVFLHWDLCTYWSGYPFQFYLRIFLRTACFWGLIPRTTFGWSHCFLSPAVTARLELNLAWILFSVPSFCFSTLDSVFPLLLFWSPSPFSLCNNSFFLTDSHTGSFKSSILLEYLLSLG